VIEVHFPIGRDRITIDRFYFDRFLDSTNVNEQDRVASIFDLFYNT
jgi:hypothetical protein